ncbi:MAG TPA: hypothetical protein VFZ49_04395 [Pyrinomonadaceae bacterium]
MTDKTIFEIAQGYGLEIDHLIIPDHEKAFKVLKGVNPIFVGTEDAVKHFLSSYEEKRPGLFEASMINYKE